MYKVIFGSVQNSSHFLVWKFQTGDWEAIEELYSYFGMPNHVQNSMLNFPPKLNKNRRSSKPRNFQTNPIRKWEKRLLIINIKAHIIIILQKKWGKITLHLFKVHSNLQYRTKNSAWRIRSLCCECLREIFWKFVWFFFSAFLYLWCASRDDWTEMLWYCEF
jgi:hypothetical protein